jgi:hypothetical protein
MGCVLFPVGAREAASMIFYSISSGTGSLLNTRTLLRFFTTAINALKSIVSSSFRRVDFLRKTG